MARPRLPALKSLEKSRLKSWLRASPFLYRSLFLLCFPPSFLVFPLLRQRHGSTVRALFSIFFHPSSGCLFSARRRAAERSPVQEDNFFLLQYSTGDSSLSQVYFFVRLLSSLYLAIGGNRVKASAVSITYYTLFFLQNKSNIIVEATARSKAPCSSN